MLGHALLHERMDVFRPHFTFGLVFQSDVGARKLFVEELYADSSSICDSVVLEKDGLELGWGDLERVDFDELELKSATDGARSL